MKVPGTQYGFDAAALADGHGLVYTWDIGNRLTQVNDTLSGNVNQVIRSYDALDRLTSETVKPGPVASPVTIRVPGIPSSGDTIPI